MGFQRVTIDEGRLIIGFGDGEWLEYPLTDATTGEAAGADYRYDGQAWVESGCVSIEAHSGYGVGYGAVRVWRIGDATPESMQYREGFRYGRQQRTRRAPAAARGMDYYHGWRAAWRDKRGRW